MDEQLVLRRRLLLFCGFIVVVLLVGGGAAAAVEVGQAAPDFSLDATTGGKISLSQFRGKQAVLIEFYGADFAPV
jgi:AhpC/TSA family